MAIFEMFSRAVSVCLGLFFKEYCNCGRILSIDKITIKAWRNECLTKS